jgi:hypothetical protein
MQMLAVYPQLQDKLYMEMENVVGERMPCHTDIANLPLSWHNYVLILLDLIQNIKYANSKNKSDDNNRIVLLQIY